MSSHVLINNERRPRGARKHTSHQFQPYNKRVAWGITFCPVCGATTRRLRNAPPIHILTHHIDSVVSAQRGRARMQPCTQRPLPGTPRAARALPFTLEIGRGSPAPAVNDVLVRRDPLCSNFLRLLALAHLQVHGRDVMRRDVDGSQHRNALWSELPMGVLANKYLPLVVEIAGELLMRGSSVVAGFTRHLDLGYIACHCIP